MPSPCPICQQKSDEIREILRPFGLDHVEVVGGVRLLAEELTRRRAVEASAAATAIADSAIQALFPECEGVAEASASKEWATTFECNWDGRGRPLIGWRSRDVYGKTRASDLRSNMFFPDWKGMELKPDIRNIRYFWRYAAGEWMEEGAAAPEKPSQLSARCQGCGASFDAEWVGTVCSRCDGLIVV